MSDILVLCIETLEVVGAVQKFLDLVVESREVMLSLGVPNANIESSLGLDSDVFDKEEAERTGQGGSHGVC